MTIAYIQTRVDQIIKLANEIAAYTPDAEQGTPEPDPVIPDPIPIDGSTIISVYDYKSPYIEINIARNEGWLRRDWMDELNEAAKESGGVTIRQGCPLHGSFSGGVSPAHTEAGDRVDLYYPTRDDGSIDIERLQKFINAMERKRKTFNEQRKAEGKRPIKLEYVMDITLDGQLDKNDWATFVEGGNHDTHMDVFRGREQ